MSGGTAQRSVPGPESGASDLTTTACYLYGIVPASTRTAAGSGAEGAPALLRYVQIAALIRELPTLPTRSGQRRRLVPATRRELVRHAEVLDRTAETTQVLPMRFGTVLESPEAVRQEVLEPNHDRFAAALAELSGRAQFTIRATYHGDVALRETLAEEPRLASLHRRMHRGRRPDPSGRVRLGELVAGAIAAKREADAAILAEALRPHVVSRRVRVWHSADLAPLAEVACLVDLRLRGRFESAAERLAQHWHGRIRLRLLGPMAPYHFVGELVPPVAGR